MKNDIKKRKQIRKLTHKNFEQLTSDLKNTDLSTKTKFKKMGEYLNKNCAKSELWFKLLYQKHFESQLDRYNKPFLNKYIPDVINTNYKYVIEIDGTLHDDSIQKEKDTKKDIFYSQNGYEVIRIKAYDDLSYIEAIKLIFKLRNKKVLPSPEFFKFAKDKGLDIYSLGMLD